MSELAEILELINRADESAFASFAGTFRVWTDFAARAHAMDERAGGPQHRHTIDAMLSVHPDGPQMPDQIDATVRAWWERPNRFYVERDGPVSELRLRRARR